jgi:hypothetical protein
MGRLRLTRPGTVSRALKRTLVVTAAATTMSLIASTADASAVAGQVSAAERSGAARLVSQGAPPGLPDLKWGPWPEWSIWTNFGKADANNWNTGRPARRRLRSRGQTRAGSVMSCTVAARW